MSIVASLLISMTACQKTETTPKVSGISQEDLALAKRIESFIEKMSNPTNLKSGGFIDVDEAIWNLEAAMNYMYADIPEQFGDTQKDSLEFTLAVNNSGFCSEGDLSVLYKNMNIAIQAYCDTLYEFQLLAVKITADKYAVSPIAVKAYVIKGKPLYSWEFGTTDWWHSYRKGRCENYEGLNTNRQSAKEIQKKVNASITPFAYPIYFTDIDSVWILTTPNPNWDSIAFPHRRLMDRYYYIYYNVDFDPSFPDNCLSPDDMNFFTSNMISFINSSDYKPAGKTLMFVTGAQSIRCGNPNKRELHEYHALLKAFYGIPHVKPCDPIQQ